MALWIWSGVEAVQFGGGDRGAEDPEHRPGVKAARHDGRNEFGRHPLHDLVGCGDGGQEFAAGSAGHFRRDESRRQDRDAGMGQHAESVPLAAGEDHLGVDEGGPGLGQLRAVAQHRRGPAAARLFLLHQTQSLAARRHVARDQRRTQRLQGDALGAVDDLGRQVLVPEVGDKSGELSAQRHDGSFREERIGLS